MSRFLKNHSRIILSFIFLASVGCTKDTLDVRVLQPGTKCDIYAGVFGNSANQPAQPVVVVDVFRNASSGLTFYDVKDSNGVIWQLPDNDLQVVQ